MNNEETPWNGDIKSMNNHDEKLRSLINEIGGIVSENKALKVENEVLQLQVEELTKKVLMMKEVMEAEGLI